MNVLMIIFLGLDQKVAIERVCFDDHVTNLIKMFILYLHMKTDRIKLMEFLREIVKLTELCKAQNCYTRIFSALFR